MGVWADYELPPWAPHFVLLSWTPKAWTDDLHGSPTPFSAPTPSLQLQSGGLGQRALRPSDRPVLLPASRDRTGLWPLQPRLLRPPAREGLPEVGGVRLRCPPLGSHRDGRKHQGASREGPGLERGPRPTARYTVPCSEGRQRNSLLRSDSRHCQPRTQAKAALRAVQVGRGRFGV